MPQKNRRVVEMCFRKKYDIHDDQAAVSHFITTTTTTTLSPFFLKFKKLLIDQETGASTPVSRYKRSFLFCSGLVEKQEKKRIMFM